MAFVLLKKKNTKIPNNELFNLLPLQPNLLLQTYSMNVNFCSRGVDFDDVAFKIVVMLLILRGCLLYKYAVTNVYKKVHVLKKSIPTM
jgi:hypothetical protein